jgi:heptosyltransferase III
MAAEPGEVFGASPRILVIRLRRLGDLLLSTPTLRAVRLAYPSARLDVLVSAGFDDVLKGNPHVNTVMPLPAGLLDGFRRVLMTCRRRRYDAVLDLQSSSRSAPLVRLCGAPVRVGWRKRWMRDWVYNRLVAGWDDPVYVARNTLRMAAAIGVPPPPDLGLQLAVSAADRAQAAALFERAGIGAARPVCALSVVAKVARKAWPPERYAQLADWLIRDRNVQLVLTSGPGELHQVEAVVSQMQARPQLWNYSSTSVHGLGAIYERCHLWIGNDGGPKHVATAVGCPTVVVLKPGDERFWTDCSEDSRQFAVRADPGAQPADSAAAVSFEQVMDTVRHALALI